MTYGLVLLLNLFYLSTQISQSAMDFFSALIFLWATWDFLKTSDPRTRWKKFFGSKESLFWILWVAYIGLSFLVNQVDSGHAIKRLLEFRWIFNLYSIYWIIQKMGPQKSWIRPATLIFCITSLFAIAVFYIGVNPLWPNDVLDSFPNGTSRTGGFLGQPIIFAHLHTVYLCLIAGVCLTLGTDKIYGKYLIPALALGVFALVLSFTRGSWISFFCACLAMTFLRSKKFFLITLAVFVGSFLLLNVAWKNFNSRTEYAMKGGDSERVYIWKANLQMFKEKPIFGVGYGENTFLLKEYYEKIGAPPNLIIAHAHNQYINFLSGTGIIGLLFYLIFLSGGIWFAYQNFRAASLDPTLIFHQGLALGTIGSQVALAFGGLTESNFEHAKMKYAMMFVWGFILWQRQVFRKAQA